MFSVFMNVILLSLLYKFHSTILVLPFKVQFTDPFTVRFWVHGAFRVMQYISLNSANKYSGSVLSVVLSSILFTRNEMNIT